ncbi:MAG: HopJ type III effector protein [Proteobacteria bacterium]|nr:HopJ type III effector protein [Pseudomonadota bacterium]
MNTTDLLNKLTIEQGVVEFSSVIDVIDSAYDFNPTEFTNGDLRNEAGQNNGSCKIFAFAKLHDLSEQQTLHCFGDYYRNDVLCNPDAADHQNIRNFMATGWSGIQFNGSPLKVKK